jgi:hypothetical protein
MSQTMPAKMMSEMPLPMPRSVICSPEDDLAELRVGAVVRLEPLRDEERLDQREDDAPVAGVLVQPLPARLTLFLDLLQLGDYDGQELQDDRGADVRHDAEREDRHLLERAAREHVEQAQERARGLVHDLRHDGAVDPRRRHERADAINGEQRDRVENPPPQLGDLADVLEAGGHGLSRCEGLRSGQCAAWLTSGR